MTIEDHAAEVMVICPGCGCSLCYGQKFRTMYLVTIDKFLICHDNKKCIWATALSIKRGVEYYEAIAQARWLLTEEQREKAYLS